MPRLFVDDDVVIVDERVGREVLGAAGVVPSPATLVDPSGVGDGEADAEMPAGGEPTVTLDFPTASVSIAVLESAIL